MTGEVADLAAKRRERKEHREHKPSPRTGSELRRYDILTGYWGISEPERMDYPMTALLGCKVCRKTIRRMTPEDEWEHVEWT